MSKPYQIALEFALVTRYIRRLDHVALEEQGRLPALVFAFPLERAVRPTLLDLAKEVERRESLPGGPKLWLISDEGDRAPMDWFSASERTVQSGESRQVHEWGVIHEQGVGYWVSFEHGKFGRRHECHQKLSTALHRLYELVQGLVDWHSFGDEESRRTLLGKGQFYWRDQSAEDWIPVDNFIYKVAGDEVTLAGVGGDSVLSLKDRHGKSDREWYNDYAHGLMRMADLVAGQVSRKSVGRTIKPRTYVPADPNAADSTAWPTGKFVVRSIYESGDEHAADVLAFITAEGFEVHLRSGAQGWTLYTVAPQHAEAFQNFPVGKEADALRAMASALRGEWSTD
jgi:hypothetical protein